MRSEREEEKERGERKGFIKDGRLVDSGKHLDLMKSNKEYENLYNVQSKYYQEGDEGDDKE